MVTMSKTGFGRRLKELREAKGWSQGKLAEEAGMNLWGIAKLEQGVNEPRWETVRALAEALGVTPNDFLTEEEPTAEEPPAEERRRKPRKRRKGS
jgi:transcriptional regulator with XRE-family HTH domain